MPYILRIFGTGTPHILGYFAWGCQKLGVSNILWHRVPGNVYHSLALQFLSLNRKFAVLQFKVLILVIKINTVPSS